VRRIEKIAFETKRIKIKEAITGSDCAEIAGILKLLTSMVLFGSLPCVRKRAIDVARKPIARIPTRSRSATSALNERKKKKRNFSFEVRNRRVLAIVFSTKLSLL
jgi:hypothetical protein